MGYSSDNLKGKYYQGEMGTVEAQETSEGKYISGWARAHFYVTLAKNVASICLSYEPAWGKIEQFELITSAKEISRQPSTDDVTQLLLTTLLGICMIKKSKQGGKKIRRVQFAK